MSHRHESLAGFPVVVTIPLLWGDQDAFGHINNVRYLRWCETARVEYLIRVGVWIPLPPRGVGPILASIKCDYKRPLNYPGTIHVGARIMRIGNSSMQMEHCIVSEELGVVAATADSTLVLLDYSSNKTVPVPAETRRIIGELEGKTFPQGRP
jgi:acyl-CoA thioester hydrolase